MNNLFPAMWLALCALSSTDALQLAGGCSRRAAMRLVLSASSAPFLSPCAALAATAADEAITSAAAVADQAITDRVRLEFVQQVSAEENRVLALTVGLFGTAAPASVAAFKAAATGTLNVPCKELTDEALGEEMTDRGRLSKKKAYSLCEGAASLPVSLAYSQVPLRQV